MLKAEVSPRLAPWPGSLPPPRLRGILSAPDGQALGRSQLLPAPTGAAKRSFLSFTLQVRTKSHL